MSTNRQPGPRVMLSVIRPLRAESRLKTWLSTLKVSPRRTGVGRPRARAGRDRAG